MSTISQILFNSPALLKRDQLVKLCELHSIEANGKNVELVERLKTHAKSLPRDSPLSIVFCSEKEGASVAQDDVEAEAPQKDSSSPATSSQGTLSSLKSSATLPKEFGTGSSSSTSHRPNPVYVYAFYFAILIALNSATNPARLPLTLPYDSPPAVWGGIRNSRTAPLYGLGWRSSHREVLRRNDVPTMCLASIPLKVIAPRWQKYMDSFLNIRFDPRYIPDVSAVVNDEENSLLCFITFNDNAKSLATLAGPDGEAFVKAAKEVMKISPDEEASFMWYRCSAER
ncbi:hypothetical protein B0H13DRAFT_2023492 [Mycena leptocephala]|nr:hypothetical protein B0H13DRAFT_2023492 [Mycena leptocephala]